MTPISDKEAAELLGVSYSTIRNAVARDALTRYQQAGMVQRVIREQVLLYAGKRRVVRSDLSPSQLKEWQRIHDKATAPTMMDRQATALAFESGQRFIDDFASGMRSGLYHLLEKKNCSA